MRQPDHIYLASYFWVHTRRDENTEKMVGSVTRANIDFNLRQQGILVNVDKGGDTTSKNSGDTELLLVLCVLVCPRERVRTRKP